MRYHEWSVRSPEEWTVLANGFVPMDQRYHDPARWHAVLTAQDTGTYNLVRWTQHSGRTAYRTPATIRQVSGEEAYWFVLPQRGVFSVRRGDREAHVPPGRSALIALHRACRLHIPASQAYAIRVPRAEVDSQVRRSELLDVVLDMRSGLGRIVRDMVDATHAERDRLPVRQFNAVCDRIGELLCMLVVGDMRPQQDHLAHAAEVVRRYVREHVGSPDLNLLAVSRALGWSPRQLRFALQQTGTTFRELRQEEALRAARDMLQDPARAGMAISDIAARNGFTPTWFSAAFKARHGETPREFRQRRLAP